MRVGPLASLVLAAFLAAPVRADEPEAGAPPPLADEPSSERLAALVSALADPALRGRFEPEGRAKAAAILDRAMADAGLAAPPTREGSRVLEFPPRSGLPAGRHVLAWIPGETGISGEHVILVASYDRAGIDPAKPSPGADAATGVAAAVEAARALARGKKPKRSVLVLALDLAEEGFSGPRGYVAGPSVPLERCAAVVGVGPLGRSLGDAMPGVLFVAGAERAEGLRRALSDWTPPSGVLARRIGLDLVPADAPITVPFEEKRIPSLFLTSGASRDDRLEGDAVDKVDLAALTARTKALVAIVRAVADLPERPAWGAEPASTREELRDLLEVVKSFEAIEKRLDVPDGPRASRRAFQAVVEGLVARGTMTKGERASVRVMAQQAWEAVRSSGR